MTTAEWMTRWEEEKRLAREDLVHTKDALMPVLRSHGIRYAVINYNGYGDSGQIDNVTVYGPEREEAPEDAYDEAGAIAMPDVVVTLPEKTGQKLSDFLHDFGWRLAYDTNPGFEINEGGQGIIVIDVEAGTINIEHGTNVTEVHYSSHEVA